MAAVLILAAVGKAAVGKAQSIPLLSYAPFPAAGRLKAALGMHESAAATVIGIHPGSVSIGPALPFGSD
jgi:hypothetical protein